MSATTETLIRLSEGSPRAPAGATLSGAGGGGAGGGDMASYLNLDEYLSEDTLAKSSTNSLYLSTALSDAANQDKTLYLPPKKYYVESGFIFDQSVKIIGEGTFALESTDNAFDQMVTVTADDVVMEGITWDLSEVTGFDTNFRGEGLRWTGADGIARDVTVKHMADEADSNIANAFVLYSDRFRGHNLTAREASFAGYRLVPGDSTITLVDCASYNHSTRAVAASAVNFIDDSPQLNSSSTAGDTSIEITNWAPEYGDLIGIRGNEDDDVFWCGAVTGSDPYTVPLLDEDGNSASLTNGYSAGKEIVYNGGRIIIDGFDSNRPPSTSGISTNKSGVIIDSEPQVLRYCRVNPSVEGDQEGAGIKAGYAETFVIEGDVQSLSTPDESAFGISCENDRYTRRFLRNLYVRNALIRGRSILSATEHIGVSHCRFEVGDRYFDPSGTAENSNYCVNAETGGSVTFDDTHFVGALQEATRLRDLTPGQTQEVTFDDCVFDLGSTSANAAQLIGGAIGDPTVGTGTSTNDTSVPVDTDANDELWLKDGEYITFSSHATEYRVDGELNLGPNSSGTLNLRSGLDQTVDGDGISSQGVNWTGRVNVGHIDERTKLNLITNDRTHEDFVLRSLGEDNANEWTSGRIEDIAAFYGNGDINLANAHWRTGDSATASHSANGTLGSNADGRFYLELTGTDSIGRKVRTEEAKRFKLDGDFPSDSIARPYLILFDASGTELTNSGDVTALNGWSLSTDASYGGSWKGNNDYDRPLVFEVAERVKYMEVGYKNVSGTNRIFSFSLKSLQPVNLDTWAENSMGDAYNQAESEPATWAGYPDEGRPILHENPQRTEPRGWVATPTTVRPIHRVQNKVLDDGNDPGTGVILRADETTPHTLEVRHQDDTTLYADAEARQITAKKDLADGEQILRLEAHRDYSFRRRGATASTASLTLESEANNPFEIRDNSGNTALYVEPGAQNVGFGNITGASYPVDVNGSVRLRDGGSDPSVGGEFRRNGPDVKVYSGGAVRNLSDVGTAIYTDEDAQDAVGTILSTQFTYDDAGNAINLDPHENDTDAHHAKYTDAEAVSAVNSDADHGSTASHNYYTDEEAQDAVGAMSDATLAYDDAAPSFGVADGSLGTVKLSFDTATQGELDAHAGTKTAHWTGEAIQDEVGNILQSPLNYADTANEIQLPGFDRFDNGGAAIADDDVYSFSPGDFLGLLWVADSDNEQALLAYDHAHGVAREIDASANVTIQVGTASGTTGVDGNLNVFVDSTNGQITVENRLGGSRQIRANVFLS